MDWQQDTKTYQKHRGQIREASRWWREKNPGEPVNITIAAREYAIHKGLPPDYFQLRGRNKEGVLDPQKIVKKISQRPDFKCPECGARLFVSLAPACPHRNPKQFTAIFSCGEPFTWTDDESFREDDIPAGPARAKMIENQEKHWAPGCGYHKFTRIGLVDLNKKIENGLIDEILFDKDDVEQG